MGNYLDTYNNDNKKDVNEDPGFLFYVFLAPYNIETEQIGKITLYKVNSNTKVIDFIRSTFPSHKRKITHVYNAFDSVEIDKYIPFSLVLHRHAYIQLVYFYEDEIYQKFKYKKVRYFDDYELEQKYFHKINLLLKNLRDKKALTKEFVIDKFIKIDDFIKYNFNNNLILIHEGKILSEDKSFSQYDLNDPEKYYEISYLEKNNENICENVFIVDKYAMLEKIGGNVYKALNVSNLKEYAIKEIKIPSNIEYDKISCELNSLSKLDKKFLVKYLNFLKLIIIVML